jgi:hypothetical protein
MIDHIYESHKTICMLYDLFGIYIYINSIFRYNNDHLKKIQFF